MTKKKQTPIPTVRGILAASLVLLLTIVSASSSVEESVELFPVLTCEADAKVGLHDVLEEVSQIESYETQVIPASRFKLFENLTFRDLLGDEDVDLYLSFQAEDSSDVHEYTCTRIKGLGNRKGYSCLNSPPSELLTIDPTSLRFARASVGAWTLYTASELGRSATLFVEKGSCNLANAE
ncbi:MAG: hypothetical protein OXG08_08615 [Gammaproteobacteria bacterium]|nr:hypothetical protein [Gammaproteobacteria bacterium]